MRYILIIFIVISLVIYGQSNDNIPVVVPLFEPPTSSVHHHGRIVNGNFAVERQFPWQVSIVSFNKAGEMLGICGGALISKKHILTAAHCTVGRVKWSIGMGSLRMSKPEKSYITIKAIQHPQYDNTYLTNDISILELPQEIELSDGIGVIDLADSEMGTLENRDALVSGFGETKDDKQIYKILKFTNMQIIPNSECLKSFARAFIKPTVLCAIGAADGNPTVCRGDSGGPLVVKEGNSYVQVGIISFTFKDCVTGKPSGYTRVSAYREWIKENTGI